MSKCYWCGKFTDKIHNDHFIPKRWGGRGHKKNLVVSCPKCNQSKHRNFWYKDENDNVSKFKKPRQLLKFIEIDNHKIAVISTVFIIRKKYKRINNSLYKSFGNFID